MASLELTENQVEEMKSFYIKEYSRLISELQHVQGVLVTLGIETPTPTAEATPSANGKTVKKAETTTSTAPVKRKRRKKRGRKATWASFITKRLKQTNRPLTYTQLINDAILEFDVTPGEEKKARQAIMNSAFRLRTVNKKITTYGIPGKKEKWVVLPNWLAEDGSLKKEYAKKIA